MYYVHVFKPYGTRALQAHVYQYWIHEIGLVTAA